MLNAKVIVGILLAAAIICMVALLTGCANTAFMRVGSQIYKCTETKGLYDCEKP